MIQKEVGLSSEEAKSRLKKYGLNEIKDVSKLSILHILLRQIKGNFILYLLSFATIICFFVDKLLTAYVLIFVIVVLIATGFTQEYKAEKAISALKGMISPVSIVLRNGREEEVFSNELVPGDILILRTGEKIPADCLIIEQKDLLVNESVLTGESKEVSKSVSKTKEYKDENLLFMGSFIVNGKALARVLHTGMNTRFGKIAGLISLTEKELPLQKKVNHIAKYMAFLGITFAILTGTIMVLKSPEINNAVLVDALILVIAISVASFPEGFPVVLITSLASGSYKMAKKNAIVNRMSIIETLGETTVICSDKTGTITKGEMTVKKIFSDNRYFDVEGSGFEAEGSFIHNSKIITPLKEITIEKLLKTSILCNDAVINRTGDDKNYHVIGTPTEGALSILAAKANLFIEDLNFERKKEIPFSSEKKFMSILVKEGSEHYVYAKGAIEILLSKCKYIQRENGIFRLLEKDRKLILNANKEMTSNTLRTLALAYKKSKMSDSLEEDLIFIGIVGMEDPPRENVKEAINMCRDAGIKVKMITGDNRETAMSIARQIGLDKGKVIEGFEIDNFSDDELKTIVKNTVVFARVRPEHKLRIVNALKQNGEIVAMTGDGVNDAPALKEAHIGIAMGKSGTDVSRSVADLTLKDDDFSTIVDAIKEGRTIFTNIQKFSTYQISINFSQVALIFLAIIAGFPLPLVAIQILFMNLFSDELTAITLAFNPYSKDVMSVRPRRKSTIITKPLFLMILISGLMMSLGSLAVFYYVLQMGKSEVAARTVVFLTMVCFGITNAFNFRSFRKRVLNRSPFSNMSLVYASIFSLCATFIIIYSPLDRFFETTQIRLMWWIVALLVSFSVVFVFDLLKLINEKKGLWSDDMQYFGNKH
jgi:P-type Ca2+ transporter type 2C